MAVHELLTLTLDGAVRARSARRRASPVELMQAVLARIDETNPDLNAVCSRRDRGRLSRRRARRRGAHRARRGTAARGHPARREGARAGRGPARGPRRRRSSAIASPRRDSIQVARLKAAGAIVVGKTNAPEFGAPAYTKNRLYGVTRSPWNLALTPGRLERRIVGGDGRGACCRWSPPATAAARSASRPASPAASA